MLIGRGATIVYVLRLFLSLHSMFFTLISSVNLQPEKGKGYQI